MENSDVQGKKVISGDEQFRLLADAVSEGVIQTDRHGLIEAMNPVAERMTGVVIAKAYHQPIGEIYRVVNEAQRLPRQDPVALCLAERRTVILPGFFILQGRGGEEHVIRDTAVPILGSEGQATGVLLVVRDLSRQRSLEKQMVYLASHDALTGLLNRQEFEIYLEVALERSREQGAEHALFYLDIMELKLVNDYYGLVAGDELLRQVGELLRQEVGEHGLLGRVSGNDFGLLLENRTMVEAQSVAQKLLNLFRDFRFTWAGQHFDVGLSIGVVLIQASSESVVQILKAADTACYLARQGGRNKLHTFVPGDAAVAERHGRLAWVHRIQRALAEDRFVLFHQEIRSLASGVRSFYEVLLRMLDDEGKLIPPGRFIPVAEEHDLATAIDLWVVRHTLKLLSSPSAVPALAKAAITINLSGRSLGDGGFLEEIKSAILESGVETSRLYFEITETAAVANMAAANRFIAPLKEMGCRFVLDDFGSGFSSFAYLKNLPVDLLKIDGEFVRSMEDDAINRAMVASVNQIGQVMGLGTIAEWVENEATYELLREMGVDFVQGYFVHRPESAVAGQPALAGET
jgi:diguanylate cyclase (GGDEF)-like protein/PAS domain S-box-containing protein